MEVGERIRRLAVRFAGSDEPGSLAARARARRWSEFARRFPEIEEMRVLDLGGTPRFWRSAPLQPAQVTVVNLIAEPAAEPWIDSREGDATEPVEGSFDLVFSNSLIEHLPSGRRSRFAQQAAEAAPRHWIQTPNRHFPIEPHWLFPGAQYLPRGGRHWLAMHWPAANFAGLPPEIVESEVENIRLLKRDELQALFPQSLIWRERFGPLTKSLVAVRTQ